MILFLHFGREERHRDLMVTWTEMLRAVVDEVHEPSTAVEFSKEEGGIGLGIWIFDPLKARFYTTIITTALAKNSAAITARPHGLLSLERKKSRNGERVKDDFMWEGRKGKG